MKHTPKKREAISSATITQTLGLILACSGLCMLVGYAADPAWWTSPGTGSQSAVMAPQVVTNDGVVTTNYVPNPYAVVTQGQLKQITVRAVDALNAGLSYSGGAGTNLNTMASNWAQDYATNGYNATNHKPSDYTTMTVGQLKYIGNKVWSRLVDAGYTNAAPSWLQQNTNSDIAVANLAQLKSVFDFDLAYDSNGLPDWWELKYFGHLAQNSTSSPDGNGLTLLQDYQQGNDPTNYYSQGGQIITPILTITGGNNQIVIPGAFASNSFVVQITNPNGGAAMVNAPITFAIPTGSVGGLALTSGGTTSSSLNLTTDSSGNATVYYQAGTAASQNNTITATVGIGTGSVSVSFEASTSVIQSGLVLWLQADAGITADDNGNVSQWQDQSSGAHIVAQTTTTNEPQIVTDPISGKPMLVFSGNQWLSSTDQIPANQDVTIISVASCNNTQNFSTAVSLGSVLDGGASRAYGYESGQALFSGYYDDTQAGSAPAVGQKTVATVTYQRSSGNVNFYLSGATNGASNVSENDLSAGLLVGDSVAFNGSWSGTVSEILVYNRVLTDNERNQAEGVLANKYGIYSANATWPSGYSDAVQTQITANQWTKSQADAYAAFLATNPPVPAPGLVLWFKADAGVTVDDSGKVSQWQDQCPDAHLASQATSANKPTLVTDSTTGKSAFQFSGNQWLSSNDQIQANQDITIITVAEAANRSDSMDAIALGLLPPGGGMRGYGYYEGQALFDGYYANIQAGSEPVAGQSTVTTMTYARSTGSVTFYSQGSTNGGGTESVSDLVNGFIIGEAGWMGNYWSGKISEELVYNRVLDTDERNQAEGYLADKYGIYSTNATWPSNYSSAVQTLIATNQWTKQQADAYVSSLSVAPVSVPGPGIVVANQVITVTSSLTGATIYYTTNGTDPTTSNASIANGGQLTVKSNTLFKFIAISGSTTSPETTALYGVNNPVSAGDSFTTVGKPDGSVWTWGDDGRGQQGDNQAHNPAAQPQQVPNLSGAISVAASGDHALAVTNNGLVWAWGADDQSQGGDGGTSDLLVPTRIASLSNIAAVYTGEFQGFAVDNNGNLYAWGKNDSGQLGTGTTANQITPEAISSVTGVIKVVSGSSHTLLLKSDGSVWSCGSNADGQLGRTTANTHIFQQVPGLANVVDIAAGGDGYGNGHSMALLADGSVWTWGTDENGELGDGNFNSGFTTPEEITSLPTAIAVAAVDTKSYVILADGTVRCFGGNFEGEMGIGTNQDQASPVQPTGIGNVGFLAAGNFDAVVCTSTGAFYGWGDNTYFKLTQDFNDFNRNSEVHDDFFRGFVKVASAENSTIGLDRNGAIWVVGQGSNGVLGQGSTNWGSAERLIQITSLSNITQIAGGEYDAFAIDNTGKLWAWGANWDGQLGVGSYSPLNTPTQVVNVQNIVGVAACTGHMLAVEANGTVWATGDDTDEELGDGTHTFEDAPIQVSSLDSVTAESVAAGDNTSFVLDATGTVWAWGKNDAGELGLGTTGDISTPTIISSLPPMIAISARFGNAMGIDVDGNVWSWGGMGNSDGTPLMQPGLSNVTSIATGSGHQLAIESNGTLWGWGNGGFGQLGNDYSYDSVPTQFTGVQGAVSVAANYASSLLVKQDGTFSGFGYCMYGQLSAGVGIYDYSPRPLFGITLVEAPPVVSITSPATGTSSAIGTAIQFQSSATASTGSITEVDYYLEGVKLGSSTTTGTWNFSYVPWSYGDYTFEAVAYDSSGVAQISTPITVTVTLNTPYDSDYNGLPDWWELKYLGQIGNDPNSSPDGNGLTLLQDYEQGNDPTNYYSQGGRIITPTLTITGGNNQTGPTRTFLTQPLAVIVKDSGNNPLVNAPVVFTVTGTGGQLSASLGGLAATSLTVNTDSTGTAQIYYAGSATASSTSSIQATTAALTVTFNESTASNDGGVAAPSNVTQVPGNTGGQIVMNWTNNATNATFLLVQQSSDDVNWVTVATINDPSVSTYTITLANPSQSYHFGVLAGNHN